LQSKTSNTPNKQTFLGGGEKYWRYFYKYQRSNKLYKQFLSQNLPLKYSFATQEFLDIH